MSRSVPATPSSITPVLVMALAGACGHSSKTLDAFEQSKTGVVPSSSGGNTGGSAGATGQSATSTSRRSK